MVKFKIFDKFSLPSFAVKVMTREEEEDHIAPVTDTVIKWFDVRHSLHRRWTDALKDSHHSSWPIVVFSGRANQTIH